MSVGVSIDKSGIGLSIEAPHLPAMDANYAGRKPALLHDNYIFSKLEM